MTLKWAAAVSRGIPRICRGEPRNLANGAAEFGKICRGKLWSLIITHLCFKDDDVALKISHRDHSHAGADFADELLFNFGSKSRHSLINLHIAQDLLAASASQAYVERVFCALGFLSNGKRNPVIKA